MIGNWTFYFSIMLCPIFIHPNPTHSPSQEHRESISDESSYVVKVQDRKHTCSSPSPAYTSKERLQITWVDLRIHTILFCLINSKFDYLMMHRNKHRHIIYAHCKIGSFCMHCTLYNCFFFLITLFPRVCCVCVSQFPPAAFNQNCKKLTLGRKMS